MELSLLEQALLGITVLGLMVGIGCSLETKRLRNLGSQKYQLATGLGLQYLLMPSLALGLSRLLQLPRDVEVIFVLIACCPGGTTSNMFSYLTKANVEMSILYTTFTSIFAFAMTPALFFLFTLKADSQISIPAKEIIPALFMTLIPIGIGYLIKLKSTAMAAKVESLGKVIGYIAISVMIVIWLPKLKSLLAGQDPTTFFAIASLSMIGMLVSLGLSRLLGTDHKTARAIAFEVGIQNAPLAYAILGFTLSAALFERLSWIPLCYGAFCTGNAIILMMTYLLYSRMKTTHGE